MIVALFSILGNIAVGQLNLSLVPSDHNGFNVSCFGEKNGAIDLTVTGGTPPYIYEWSTGASTQDVVSLPAGYYAVLVIDADSAEMRADITLTEPEPFKAELVPFEYPNGYNISLYNAYNGSIDLTTYGGVAPYSYSWHDGPTTEDRTALGSDNYGLLITDANGCGIKTDQVYLRQPDRSDWTNTGNAGTDPATHYIGTSDNKDVVFKSNGAERLRLKSDGDIKLGGSLTTPGLLYRDPNGILRSGGLSAFPLQPGQPCRLLHYFPPYWETIGNDFSLICPDEIPKLGTLTDIPLRIVTNGQLRMFISADGKVGIGTQPPAGAVDGFRLFVEDGISTRDVLVKVGTWPDYVFADGYHLMPLSELRKYLTTNRHLPGVPSAQDVAEKNGVEVGDLQAKMLKVVEEQALYILALEEKYRLLEQRMVLLETSK